MNSFFKFKKKTQNKFLRIFYKLQEDNSAAVKKQAEGASNPMYQVVWFS